MMNDIYNYVDDGAFNVKLFCVDADADVVGAVVVGRPMPGFTATDDLQVKELCEKLKRRLPP